MPTIQDMERGWEIAVEAMARNVRRNKRRIQSYKSEGLILPDASYEEAMYAMESIQDPILDRKAFVESCSFTGASFTFGIYHAESRGD